MGFEFATAGRISFGAGVLREAGELATGLGRRALVVSGRSSGGRQALLDLLGGKGITVTTFVVTGEPTVDVVREGVRLGCEQGCEFVAAIGGGSPLDTGKAIAAMLANPGDITDYLEVVGAGKRLANPSLPVIAIPTTAGTGTEVTRNAVIGSPDKHVKVSLRNPYLLPRFALVDPELTYSLPPQPTAYSGMDALVQLIEPYLSPRSNSLTDGICREGIKRVARSLLRAYQHGNDGAAREDMCLASLFGGLALANASLGAVHGFASVIGGLTGAPHGAICARLLAPGMKLNGNALKERAPGSPALERLDEISAILTDNPRASLDDGINWVETLCADLHIPTLADLGLREQDIPRVAEGSLATSSMKANPIQLKTDELAACLQGAL